MGAVHRTRLLVPAFLALGLCGCGAGGAPAAGPGTTATVTVTVTAEPTAEPTGESAGELAEVPTGFPSGYRPVELEVHADGCGVVRNSTPEIERLRNLGWSVLDADGFEVLQRNAVGETRYRFYQPGSYTVEMTAWDGEKYAAVSNRVDIDC